ncbi:20435_t:CDS:2, partial [Rhizophagus irregularis]
ENDSRISFTSDMWTLDTASTITIDNGANQVAAMKLLSTALETNLQVDFNVIRCGAHTIALV